VEAKDRKPGAPLVAGPQPKGGLIDIGGKGLSAGAEKLIC
jgi:hypothetical protein